MIEKRISETLLDSGEVALTDHERDLLELPPHSFTVELELEGDRFNAQWSGAGRFLHGDILAERLQDFGQVGGLLRLLAVGDRFRLELVAAPRSGLMPLRKPTSPPRPAPIDKRRQPRKAAEQRFYTDADYAWADGIDAKVGSLKESRDELTDQLAKSGFDPAEWLTLRLEGEHLATMDEFEELLAVDVSNVDRMPHQEAVTRRVLARMGGRAILADEVGLGKTIEAGLAVKELVMRGRARRILILCPASLREQWQQELSSKFELNFDIAWRGNDIGDQERMILSSMLGAKNLEKLTRQQWDIVIVDEAHRAAGANAKKTQQLIESLSRTSSYALFLTATPVQNDLMELYRLVQLLRPGTFRSASEFRSKFMRNDDPRKPKDPASLRSLINSAMVRMTRSQAGLDRVKRAVSDIPLALTGEERDLYDRYVKVLRTVASSPTHAGRTRSLSIMLTALPGAMGARLLRMAEQTSDPGLEAELRDLAERALGITDSGRERAALDLVRRYLREHGRVLIFTQHTDSLTSLVRTLAREDIDAAAFHGSMAPGERARAIAQFRDGSKPVLVSTDAGAEGQNLQFCNCVINFDLPWNPMRIEQRIGRVDRLTQPKDTVYVANLFALGTIDERVYRLLAEKLKMFELLFGQVTTILGELDDSDLTFEGRVIKAVTASDDTQMNRELDSLGSHLSEARKTAGDYIAADSSLSEWLRTTFDHRSDIDRRGAAELSVEIEERTRERQRRVQQWVRSIFDALDAEIVHDTGDQRGAFVTVRFSDEVADELGGRTVLHLAFDRDGLDHHPDAELCAVGTPVFTELLQIVRQRGDIHATVPVLPPLEAMTLRHSPRIELVEHKFVPSGSWSGIAVYRAAIGEAEQSERVESVLVGEAGNVSQTPAMPRRALELAEPLPAAFDHAPAVVARFDRAAASQFSNVRIEKYDEIRSARRSDLERIRDGYRAQIAEARYDDVDRLERALELEEQRLGREPDVRVRARLLSVTLHEDDWGVEEQWRHVGGTERTRTYMWRADGTPYIVSDVSGNAADVVSLCSAGHWIDESEARHCTSCDGDRCDACGGDGSFGSCELCGETACGHCISSTGGFCLPCSVPEREPDLDIPNASGWRFRSGNTALVSERACVLSSTDGSQRTIVPDGDVDDDHRVRVRAYAASIGLPGDTGVIFQRTDAPVASHGGLLLHREVTVEVERTEAPDGGSAIDPAAVEHIPLCPEVDVQSERGARIQMVLARLREQVTPASGPAIVLTERARVREIRLLEDSVVDSTTLAAPDGSIATVEHHEAAIAWTASARTSARIGSATVNGSRIDLDACNEAVLVTFAGPHGLRKWIAADSRDEAPIQLAWADHLRVIGNPGGRIARRVANPAFDINGFAEPSDCELVDRTIVRAAALRPVSTQDGLTTASAAELGALGLAEIPPVAISPLSGPVAHSLINRARSRPYTEAVVHGFRITESWKGAGSAALEYETYDGVPQQPPGGRDFGVCTSGHFSSASQLHQCAACRNWACERCESDASPTQQCPSCTKSTCAACLRANHDVAQTPCSICHDYGCNACGRDPAVEACIACERPICGNCRRESTCNTCATLAPASHEDVASLPGELAACGASVWVGSDESGSVVVISSPGRLERAVIDRTGAIADWVAFDSTDQSRASVSRSLAAHLGVAVQLLSHDTRKADPPASGALPAYGDIRVAASWSAPSLGRSAVAPITHTTTNAELITDLVELFPMTKTSVVPRRADLAPALIHELTSGVRVPAVDVEISWTAVGREVYVVANGLLVRRCLGVSTVDSLIPWRDAETDASWPWVAEAWDPQPRIRAVARSDDVEAAVVSVGNRTCIGFRVGDASTWLAIDGGPAAVSATALARTWDLPDASGVDAWTNPGEVVTSMVNGTDASRAISPRPELVSPSAETDPAPALVAWGPALTPRQPRCSQLAGTIAQGFRARFAPEEPLHLAIGVAVEQRFTVDGSDVVFQTTLAPGNHDARRRDDVTGLLLDRGSLDRSGHFVASTDECRYCKKLSCQLCTDGVRTCRGCGIAVCLPCSTTTETLTLCPACTLVSPATRKQAHDYGRRLFAGGLFVGVDAVHTVAYEHKGSRWLRYIDESTTIEVTEDAIRAHLDQKAVKK